MGEMEIDARLRADTHFMGELQSGVLLLHRNATLPWFILVPRTTASELHEVEEPLRSRITADTDAVAAFLCEALEVDKVNVAAIGNIVSQLHVHIIGRRRDDPCWPGVVWGRLPDGPAYTEQDLGALAAAMEGA